MKINNIKINAYGNLEHREINFDNKINIVKGKNESGKSTMLSYIINMFYGISNNKNGKNISDYDKYLPWSKEEFSGKLDYELDNGMKYQIFRNFKKKNPKIYNEKSEDITSSFAIDKKDGSQFFLEQTNIDKQMYLSTVVSMQQEVTLDEKSQNILIQKIANLAGTGEENISYKKAVEKLSNKIRDEIGTNKTTQKPINIIESKLSDLENKLEEIRPYEAKKYNIDIEKESLQKELKQNIILKNIATKIKENENNIFILQSKLIDNKNKLKLNDLKLDKLYEENENYKIKQKGIENEIGKVDKKSKKLFLPFLIVLVIISVISWIILKNNLISILESIITVITASIYTITTIKNNRNINEKIQEKNNLINTTSNQIANINGQIELLEKENDNLEIIVKDLENEIEKNKNNLKQEIADEYKEKLDITSLEKIINANNISLILEETDNKIREKSIELNKKELEETNILAQLDNIVKYTEEKEEYEEQLKYLKDREEIFNIAINNLKEAYEEMKNTITPQFTKNLSENINIISNHKYNKVVLTEENNMMIEKSNGELVEADKLSLGTIDQLYLSLRLSMLEDISKEKLPIILDETFAYFDNNRLENVLNYLNEKSDEHQIIIFTCNNREENIYEKIGIKCNIIEL